VRLLVARASAVPLLGSRRGADERTGSSIVSEAASREKGRVWVSCLGTVTKAR